MKKISLNKLKLKTYNLQYVSVPVKEYNGRYKYHSVKQEKEVSNKNFAISENIKSLYSSKWNLYGYKDTDAFTSFPCAGMP